MSISRALLSAKSSIINNALLFGKPSIHGSCLHRSRVLITPRAWLSEASVSTRKVHFFRASQSSGMDRKEPSEDITKSSEPEAGPPRPAGLPIPNLATCRVKLVLGSIICLVVPFYHKVLRIEDGVEKVAETVVEVTEVIAEATEKVASDIANALPDNKLKQEVLVAEQFAEEVDKDAKKAEEFIHKVDHIKQEVETLVESITNVGEATGKETKETKKTRNSNL